MNFYLLKELLIKFKRFIITTHINPDADALGSQIAFYLILKKLNKEILLLNHSDTPENLKFLDFDNKIEKYVKEKHIDAIRNYEVIVLLDLNQANRIAAMEKDVLQSNLIKICLDHHQNPSEFADYMFCEEDYCATGEIIYDFIKETNIIEIDKQIAIALYAAIMTDTGSFRFPRTSPKIHRIVADLLEKGADPTEIYEEIYGKFDYEKILLQGEAIANIKLALNGKVSYMIITKKQLEKYNASEADVDGFVNYCLNIKGVVVSFLFMELQNGIKVSLRSKGNIPINKLAAEFGGGGHFYAAGIRIKDYKLDDFIPVLLKATQKYVL
jgi:phosphoesterase RecJ-like protein